MVSVQGVSGELPFAYIFTGSIAALFLILAIFLLNGKGSFLIAGYNTMSNEKKSTYDTKALCRAVGWLLLALALGIMLFPLSLHLETPWLSYVAFVILFTLPIGFVIYANTGNRFRINVNPPEPSPDKTRFKDKPH
jgi:cell division protein FtsW (lipid II flippase)